MILVESKIVVSEINDEAVDKDLLELNSMFNVDNNKTVDNNNVIDAIKSVVVIDTETIFDNLKYMLDSFKDINADLFLRQEKMRTAATTVIAIDYKLCPECKLQCKIKDTTIICEQCGIERQYDCHTNDNYSLMVDSCYNTTSNSFMSFNVVGTNAYFYQRSMMRTCADYSIYRNNSNKKDIINRIWQYEGNKPPMNVINTASDLFDEIKANNYVFRGDGKLGVIGACLYYASIKHNLTRTPREISNIMGIDEKFLSQGDRILQELNEMGIIEIQTNYKPLEDYLNQFMPILGIPLTYKPFVIHIIARAERKHLHVKNESRLTTKVVGVLYLLTRRVPELKHIKKDIISKECNNISKSTFIRYYNLICSNYKILKKSFRKYKIPQPIEWRGA
jgi:transcription initiation factor TFIIIB Brf1 subunit/transcription initiation factor TFIIB